MGRHDVEGTELVVRVGFGQASLSARGPVEVCTAPLFLSCLLLMVNQGTTEVVVDLSDTTFLDCRGLAALTAARDALRAGDRSLVLRGADGVVYRIIAMSNLGDLLDDRSPRPRPVLRAVSGSARR